MTTPNPRTRAARTRIVAAARRVEQVTPWRALRYIALWLILALVWVTLTPYWATVLTTAANMTRLQQGLLTAVIGALWTATWLRRRYTSPARALAGPVGEAATMMPVTISGVTHLVPAPDATDLRMAAHVVAIHVMGGQTAVVATARTGATRHAQARSTLCADNQADIPWRRIVGEFAGDAALDVLDVPDADRRTSTAAAFNEAVSIVAADQRPSGYTGDLTVRALLRAGDDYARLIAAEHHDLIRTVATTLVVNGGCLNATQLAALLPARNLP